MKNLKANHITESVLDRLANTPDPAQRDHPRLSQRRPLLDIGRCVWRARIALVTDWLQLANGSYQLDFDFVLNPV